MSNKPGDNTLPGCSKNSSDRDYPYNPEDWMLARKQDVLRLRSEIVFLIRRFFRDRYYLEVETPVLIPTPAPELHIDAVACGSQYLQTSPELCMKRLLASGYSRIFQICRCFREAERGARHLPEFSMLEWYARGEDYLFLMEECEALFRYLANTLYGKEEITFQGNRIALSHPWERLSVSEAFQRFGGMSAQQALAEDCYDEVLTTRIEPRLGNGRPTFLYDYPSELAALARTKQDNPLLAERFELYLAGMELANAFSELIDPVEQAFRFKETQQQRSALGKDPYPWPERFLRALPAMPPSAGIALGVDRLIMLMTDKALIDDVIAFPPEGL